MKYFYNIIIYIFCFCALYIFCTSCQENGDIGDLYGQWQLTSIHKDSTIQKNGNAFLAFQNDCVFARITDNDNHYTHQIIGEFIHDGNTLKLRFVVDEEKEGAEVIHQYLSTIFGFPLPHTDIKFEIKQLDSSKLVLSNNDTYWDFRIY